MWLLKSCILKTLLYFKQNLAINLKSNCSHDANIIHS